MKFCSLNMKQKNFSAPIDWRGRGHFFALFAAMGVTFASLENGISFLMAAACALFAFFLFRPFFPVAALALVICFIFYIRTDFANGRTSILSENTDVLFGKIVSVVSVRGDQLSFVFRIPSGEKVIAVAEGIKSRDPHGNGTGFYPGLSCVFAVNLQKPPDNGNFYGFDYRRYLNGRGIFWIAKLQSANLTHCRDDATVFERVRIWRQNALSTIALKFPEEIAALTEALLFGEQQQLAPSIRRAYQKLGIIHVLAVSGLHVTCIAAALTYLFVRFGLTKETATTLLLFIIPLYVILAGSTPSVIRAGLTACLVLLYFRFGRRIHPFDAIGLVFSIMLFLYPHQLFLAGFQLSFAVTFALMSSSRLLTERIRHSFFRLLAASVIAQTAALPVLLYHFYEISLLSPFINVFIVPLFSVFLLPLSFFSFLFVISGPSWLSEGVLAFFSAFVAALHHFLRFLAEHFSATLIFGQPSPLMLFVLSITVLFAFYYLENGRNRYAAFLAFIPLLTACCIQLIVPYLSPVGEVVMFDVGQGESILIELPYRRDVYLIDTGGIVRWGRERKQKEMSFNVGRDIVAEQLKARGIRRVDRLVFTHGDRDHIGGALGFLDEIDVAEIMFTSSNSRWQKKVLKKAISSEIKIVRGVQGMRWQSGANRFFVLYPPSHMFPSTENDASIVIYAQIGGLRWLFTGDISSVIEQQLLRQFPALSVDVLKVAHHGSQKSTAAFFLKATTPKYAFISAGKNNLYGHPAREVLTRLVQNGVIIFRTDCHGSVAYIFHKKSGRFRTKRSPAQCRVHSFDAERAGS